jgi:hypothetical protein
MGCCGQKRSHVQFASPPSAVPGARAVPAADSGHALARSSGQSPSGPAAWPPSRTVLLRYHDRARLLVRGPVTGHPYAFSADQPAQAVEARDAEVLLRTRRFLRI